MDEEWISLREFARRKGVNVAAVQSALRNGRIVRREEDKRIHWPSQSVSWDRFRDPSKVRGSESSKPTKTESRDLDEDEDEEENAEESDYSSSRSYLKAKAKREIAQAGLKEIELQEAKGELVRASFVRSAITQLAIDVRDGIMTIPDRVAAELAAELAGEGVGMESEKLRLMVHRLWRRESAAVLERLSGASGQR